MLGHYPIGGAPLGDSPAGLPTIHVTASDTFGVFTSSATITVTVSVASAVTMPNFTTTSATSVIVSAVASDAMAIFTMVGTIVNTASFVASPTMGAFATAFEMPLASYDLNLAGGYGWDGTGAPVTLASVLSVTRAQTVPSYAEKLDGTLVSFAANTLRQTNKGLLLEESRTQICIQTEAFNTGWTGSGNTNSQDGTLSRDPAKQAWLVTQTGANATDSRLQKNITVANDSTTYVMSVDIKKIAGAPTFFPALKLQIVNGTGVINTVVVNPQTGAVVGLGSAGTYGVIDCGTFWRAWVIVANNSSGNTTLAAQFYPGYASSLTTTQSTINGAATYFAFPQVEAGAFPTSYIPNTGNTTITRSADTISMGGALSTAALAAAAAYAETTQLNLGSGGCYLLRYATGTATVYFPNTTSAAAFNGSLTVSSTIGSSGNIAGNVKAAFGLGASAMSTIANAGTRSSSGTAWAGNTGTVWLGSNASGNQSVNGYIKRIVLSATFDAFSAATGSNVPAALNVITSAASSATIPAFTSSAAMTVSVAVASAVQMPNFTSNGAVNINVLAAGSATMGLATSAATIVNTASFTAAIQMAAFTPAAAANVIVSMAAAAAMANFTLAATGVFVDYLVAGPTLPNFSLSAAIQVPVQLSANVTMAPLLSAGVADTLVTGAAAVTMAPFTSSAAITVLSTAAGASTISPFTSAATIQVPVKFASAASIANFVTISAMQVFDNARLDATIANFSASAAINILIIVNGAATIAPLVSTAAIGVPVRVVAAPVMQPFTATAVMNVKITGSGTAAMGAFSSAAQINVLVSAQASIQMAPFTVAAAAKNYDRLRAGITMAPFVGSGAVLAYIRAISNSNLGIFVAIADIDDPVLAQGTDSIGPFTAVGRIEAMKTRFARGVTGKQSAATIIGRSSNPTIIGGSA